MSLRMSVQVFFCSFLPAAIKVGQMQVALTRRGVPSKLYSFSGERPDLTKFDTGLLPTIARLGTSLRTILWCFNTVF